MVAILDQLGDAPSLVGFVLIGAALIYLVGASLVGWVQDRGRKPAEPVKEWAEELDGTYYVR